MAVEIVVDEDDDNPTQETTQEPVAEQVIPEPPAEDVPDKYKGKSAADLAKMHVEAERLIGRQGEELGRLRQSHDEIIRASLTKPPSTETQDPDVEFFQSPTKAVSKLLESHPALQELKQAYINEQRNRNKEMFVGKHPDYRDVLSDPKFQQWVNASQIRQAHMARADQDYDFAAADEVFSTYKELRGVVKADDATRAALQKDALRAGTVPTGTAAPSTEGGKKIYRRADLIRLMQTDRERYEALSDEILLAYEEGRVR